MAIDQTAIAQLEATPVTYEGGLARPAQSYWSESWERLRGSTFGMFFGGVLVVLAMIAIAAPLFSAMVTHVQPTSVDLSNNFATFSRAHLLGTDELGRDTLTRLVYAARVSLGVGFLTVAIYLLIGGTVGITAGFYGGLLLATRSIGASNLRLMGRHLLPNVLPVMIVAASLGVGQIILLEAALDFIGLGVQPPTPSWGNMLLNAQSYFYHSTWLVLFPGFCIVLAVLSANIFGNAVRDAFDPRLK